MRFKDNICAADLAEMGSLLSTNKTVIDVFTKYAWVKPMKNKKGKIFLNVFMEIVNESNRKPNRLKVDQGRAFYNKEWLDNTIVMYYTHNENKQ